MTEAATLAESDTVGVVVFGVDEKGKPHASAFGLQEAHLAAQAAKLMGMSLLPVETDECRALAAKLPRGRVFESGRAFVPFVASGVYEALAAIAGLPRTGLYGQPGPKRGRSQRSWCARAGDAQRHSCRAFPRRDRIGLRRR
jgi:hypothetical protein